MFWMVAERGHGDAVKVGTFEKPLCPPNCGESQIDGPAPGIRRSFLHHSAEVFPICLSIRLKSPSIVVAKSRSRVAHPNLHPRPLNHSANWCSKALSRRYTPTDMDQSPQPAKIAVPAGEPANRYSPVETGSHGAKVNSSPDKWCHLGSFLADRLL